MYKGSTKLKENEFLINEFEYFFLKTLDSNQCRGTTESIKFNYQETNFEIIARDVYPVRSGLSEPCESKGKLIGVYEGGKNLPKKCSGNIDIPANTFTRIDANCSSRLKIEILDLEKFNLCLSLPNCTLVNGIEVKISY